MDIPSEFATSDIPAMTNADWSRLLEFSRTYIANLVANGTLTPQRLTTAGRPLFEPEYVEWAKTNVPLVVRRLAEIRRMSEVHVE